MKHLPNIITSVRLLAALALIVMSILGYAKPYFVSLFIAGGVSDMLDGYIARKFDWCTEFGATLDSVSDLCLYMSVVLFFSLNAGADFFRAAPFFAIGAAGQAMHLTYALSRFKQFPAYHTTFSRACAYTMFFGVLLFWHSKSTSVLPALALLWLACSCEGLAITAILNQPASNLSGIGAARRKT